MQDKADTSFIRVNDDKTSAGPPIRSESFLSHIGPSGKKPDDSFSRADSFIPDETAALDKSLAITIKQIEEPKKTSKKQK